MENRNSKRGYQGLIVACLRIVKALKNIIAIGLIIEVLVNSFNLIGALDVPWQLREGNFILTHGYPARSVFQAYGEISPQFANEYIFYEIVLAGINHIAGTLGLYLFFGLLGFFIYIPCLLAFIRSRGRFFLFPLLLFFLAQFAISLRLSARPELIADVCYLAAGTMLVFLQEKPWNGYWIFCFGLIFCIWSNVHGSFLIGLAMVGLWHGQFLFFNWKTILSTKDLFWIRPGMAALIGCLLNPYGFLRFAQPFKLHSFLWGQATSAEMWPTTPGSAWLPLTCTIGALLLLISRIRERKNYWMVIMLFALEYLTFVSNRYLVFIGLTLLIAIWNEVRNVRKSFFHSKFQLPFALGQLMIYFILTIRLLFLVLFTFQFKWNLLEDRTRLKSLQSAVTTDSSFVWLQEHPEETYILLSYISPDSWAQIPNQNGIHPLLDSGTHRYSERVNQLYYYTLFSPDTLRLVLSKLNVNAIILVKFNMYWASVLNENPDWYLAQIEPDSQLYLRRNNHDASEARDKFLQWDENAKKSLTDIAEIPCENIIRGLKLRSDADSLRMLKETRDVSWMFDPQITYIQEWLEQVPDNLVEEAQNSIGDKTDNSSAGLHILFSLRLKQYRQAAEMAKKWNPSILDNGYQDLQQLRAEALISSGDIQAAAKLLKSLWPQPRYSLRWAKLCQRVYINNSNLIPKNARLLTGFADDLTWQISAIASLNQNISRLATQPHN